MAALRAFCRGLRTYLNVVRRDVAGGSAERVASSSNSRTRSNHDDNETVGASGQVAPVTKAPPDHPSLACTNCHGRLEREGDALACASCASTFPLVDGIPSFCKTEPFYEDYLEEHCPFVRNPPLWKRRILRVLPYWSWRGWGFFLGDAARRARGPAPP